MGWNLACIVVDGEAADDDAWLLRRLGWGACEPVGEVAVEDALHPRRDALIVGRLEGKTLIFIDDVDAMIAGRAHELESRLLGVFPHRRIVAASLTSPPGIFGLAVFEDGGTRRALVGGAGRIVASGDGPALDLEQRILGRLKLRRRWGETLFREKTPDGLVDWTPRRVGEELVFEALATVLGVRIDAEQGDRLLAGAIRAWSYERRPIQRQPPPSLRTIGPIERFLQFLGLGDEVDLGPAGKWRLHRRPPGGTDEVQADVVDRVHARYPGWRARFREPWMLEIRGDLAGRVSVLTLRERIEGLSQRHRRKVIDEFVAWIGDPKPAPRMSREQVLASIVPVVRTRAWLAERSVHPWKTHRVAAIDLAADFRVVFEVDDRPLRLLTHAELDALGVAADALIPMAMHNLRERMPPPHIVEEEPLLVAQWGDGTEYDSSLLLDSDLWRPLGPRCEGGIVAAVPARDRLVFTGARTQGGQWALRSEIDEAIGFADSARLLAWIGDGWRAA